MNWKRSGWDWQLEKKQYIISPKIKPFSSKVRLGFSSLIFKALNPFWTVILTSGSSNLCVKISLFTFQSVPSKIVSVNSLAVPWLFFNSSANVTP